MTEQPEHEPVDPEPAPPKSESPTYEQAAARIEEIIRRLDSGDAGLRETLDLVREGRGLVERCATELEAVSHGLQELELDELIARLEGGGGVHSTAPTDEPSSE